MILITIILVLFISPFVDVNVYVYNTADSPSVELYDCIVHEDLYYCRRPTEPIALNRSNDTMQCYHNGTVHLFSQLLSANVSISTVLHQWKSSIEKVEQYTRYTRDSNKLDGYVCECRDPQSFGKNCEYRLSMGTTFAQTVIWENSLKRNNPQYVQLYGDIICYMTLECNSGLLCLDWRDICDGVQQCMSGLDEENCDKLEFNECENDEYRCMNGMCIPDEYFLDGAFDCLDWSDEIQYFDDINCPIEAASVQCDDRICPPNQFSCGDGQCIRDRLDFQIMSQVKSECRYRRDQYFLCETHYLKDMWTLPNGRCYEGVAYDGSSVSNRTYYESCEYILLCDLSSAVEKHCPCGKDSFCNKELDDTCPSSYIQYPKAGIMAPYVLFYYPIYYQLRPTFFMINGTIKCDEILINITGMNLSFTSNLRKLEHDLCQEAKNRSSLDNHNHHRDCHRYSLTFSNRSYSLSDVCNASNKCTSTYRIKDGFENCVDKMDEIANISISTICSKMQRYRFRCSADEPTCLSVSTLGNSENNCQNKFDEFWLGTSTKLENINCNRGWKDQCEILRQYIEKSWIENNESEVAKQRHILFRYYCDTFWNLASKDDENVKECREWWICPDEQWQCDTGQCIDEKWVLDDEWDCMDASDEDDMFNRQITDRNLQVVPLSMLINRSVERNKSIPFSNLCNLTTEFPCFPINFSHPLNNLIDSRPCIDRHRIGDGHIDCSGAIDERNTLTHCDQATMLGYNFKCRSSNQCIPYWNYCFGEKCNIRSFDQSWCDQRESASTCNRYSDTICFDGTCVKNGRCDRIADCSFGEDEYMCEYQDISKLTGALYRKDKEIMVKNTQQKLRLIQFPFDSNSIPPMTDSTDTVSPMPTVTTTLNNTAPIAYWCNRGIGVEMHNGSIACFCPPQYYGDKCQFHTDRIPILLHLDLSQSIYTRDSEIQIVLKMVVLFLFENEIITNHIFHVRPVAELFVYSKKKIHFLYSRSSRFLQHKKQRYFNQSNIINHHPYSIRIEMYERKNSGEPILIAVWQYPVYFDYLPVFRFTKVLRLTKPNMKQNPCSSNPCNQNQDCQQLINDQLKYICLCKGNFTGEDCSIEDQQCINGYCSVGSICKPNYRGLLIGNELPYCICPFDMYGEHCDIKHDRCLSAPCLNNGSCFPTPRLDTVSCVCTKQYHGRYCESKKPEVKLYINESVTHAAAVVQYFAIDFISLNLILSHQQVYRTLPTLLEYRHEQKTAPEIILVKLYSSQIEIPAELYLISVHINVATINATTQITKKTRCLDSYTLISGNDTQKISSYSPIKYHYLCRNNTSLLCFHDDFYLCICDENHSRVECFHYDSQLDQCSHCLSGGRCLKGDRLQPNDFICLCPLCHSGTNCQFNSNSFAFTLDQLFFADLISKTQKTTILLLILIPLFLFFLALPNNLFSIITFRRQKCLCNGIGQYLFYMSIINQISLSVLVARLIQLSVTITGFQSHSIVDTVFCKVLSYSLICFTRIAYWLISFVTIERAYTTLFLKGRWLKQPYVARRLIILTFFIVFISGAYELVFVRSFVFDDNGNRSTCIIDFPNSVWMIIHQIVSITNAILPLLINLYCTVIIIRAIIKSKMNIRMPKEHNEATPSALNENTNTLKSEENIHIEKHEENIKLKETHHRLNLLRDVLNDNKEMITRPAITLIPSFFSLFSYLPLFIMSFSLGCRNIEGTPMRYPLIAFYFTSFIPQIITFFLYVYPSSLYFNEWRSTRIGQWITALRR